MLEFNGILIFLMYKKSLGIVKILKQRDTCANSWSNNLYMLRDYFH